MPTSPFRVPKAQVDAVVSPPAAVVIHRVPSTTIAMNAMVPHDSEVVDDCADKRKRKSRARAQGCNCNSTTRCLKRYCECFKRSENCTDACRCKDCGNSKNVLHGTSLPRLSTDATGSSSTTTGAPTDTGIDLAEALFLMGDT